MDWSLYSVSLQATDIIALIHPETGVNNIAQLSLGISPDCTATKYAMQKIKQN